MPDAALRIMIEYAPGCSTAAYPTPDLKYIGGDLYQRYAGSTSDNGTVHEVEKWVPVPGKE